MDVAKLYALQGRLARALYALEQQILGFKQQTKELVAGKKRGDPAEDFLGKIQRIEEHIHAAESAIDRGKVIGDSFAWLFIAHDQPLLRKHYEHERLNHLPVGTGGIGEIEFIANAPRWGSHVALYHGITTFLRIGDVSFVNLQTGKIEGMAELKTRRVAPDQIRVSVTYVGQKLLFDAPPLDRAPPPADAGPADAQKFRDILRRQEEKIRVALASPAQGKKPIHRFEGAGVEFAPQALEELFDQAAVAAPSCVQFSPSVHLVGIKLPVATLADRVLNQDPVGAEAIVARVGPELVKAGTVGNPDNALEFGWLVFPSEGRYQLPFGVPPLLWWPIRPEVIEAMAAGSFSVMTFFNPAALIASLKRQGFTVLKKHPVRGFELRRPVGKTHEIAFKNVDYFFNLVSRHLMTEASVVDLIARLADDIAQRKLGGRIDLEMVFRGWDSTT